MWNTTRREFLKFLGFTGVGTALSGWWGRRSRARLLAREEFREGAPVGSERWVTTVCRLCPGACGIRVRLVDGRPVRIEGNPECPISQGALCPRGLAGLQTLWAEDRVRAPLRRAGGRGEDRWEPLERQAAVTEIGRRLRRSGGRVAAIVGEDRGLAPSVWAAFLGRPAWSLAGDEEVAARAAGEVLGWEDAPIYDFASSRAILSLECPLLEGWRCATVLHRAYGQFRRDRLDLRGRLIQVDAWRSPTARKADLWVPVAPGTSSLFALSMANVLLRSRWYDPGVEAAPGFVAWRATLLERFAPEMTARVTGVAPSVVLKAAQELWDHRPAVAVAGAPVVGATAGLETHRAALWLNALCGSVGAVGGVLRRRRAPAPPVGTLERAGARRLAARLSEPGGPEVIFLHEAGGLGRGPGWEILRVALRKVPFVVALGDRLSGAATEADMVMPMPPALETWDAVPGEDEVRVMAVGVQQPLDPTAAPPDLAAVLRDLSAAAGGRPNGLPRDMGEAARARFERLARSGRGGSYGALLESSELSLWEAARASGGWWEVIESWREPPAVRFGDPLGGGEAGRDPSRPLILVPHEPLAASGMAGSLPYLRELVGWDARVAMHPATARGAGAGDGDQVVVESARGAIRGRLRVTEEVPEGSVVVAVGAAGGLWGVANLQPDWAAGIPRWSGTPVRVVREGSS